MKYGFFTDVHGDLEALRWVLDTLAEADQLYFLGDVCGGREVSACLELMSSHQVFCVPGNHDLWDFELTGLSSQEREYLAALPLKRTVQDWLAVHSDFFQDQQGISFPYIYSESDARRALAQFPERLIFFGHTHASQLHQLLPDGQIHFRRPREPFQLERDCRYLINVGAAAQACLLYDSELQRIDYRFRQPAAVSLTLPLPRSWWRKLLPW